MHYKTTHLREHNISPLPTGFQTWTVDTKSCKCPGRERMRTGRGETKGWGWAVCDGQAQISAGWLIGMSGACAGAIWGVSWHAGVSCQAGGVAWGVTPVVCAGGGTLRRRLACHRVPLLSKKVAGPSWWVIWRGADQYEASLLSLWGLRTLTQSVALMSGTLTRAERPYFCFILFCWRVTEALTFGRGPLGSAGLSLSRGRWSSRPSMRKAGETPVVECWVAL